MSWIHQDEQKKFEAGTFYDLYKKLGAHPCSQEGIGGVFFAVWEPEAESVGVAGVFNEWNASAHQMQKVGNSGIYELFIPNVSAGMSYKFDVKISDQEHYQEIDPCAFYRKEDQDSIVWDLGNYHWNDDVWMKTRGQKNGKEQPISIYELHLDSWLKDCDYRELGHRLSSYVKEMGFTHVEFLFKSEDVSDAEKSLQKRSYFAPKGHLGTPDEFRALIDLLHGNGIGVILNLELACFLKDIYNRKLFLKKANFMISNALYWVKEFHVDGILIDHIESMLYLDYGKHSGEWTANLYGSNENLEIVEFLRHLNYVFHREGNGAVTIARDSSSWPRITGKLEDQGLGFDYKWNVGWMNDFLRYMRCLPQERCQNYGDLTLSMLYAYSEDFIQIFSHDEMIPEKGSMFGKMPGETKKQKLANLRAAYGFFFGHPGKKLMFMGQEFAQTAAWDRKQNLEWELLKDSDHMKMKEYVTALNEIYSSHPALYENDYEPSGFEWVNCTSDQENIVVFIRRSKNGETIVLVCNFSLKSYKEFQLGVPFAGIYQEILNSDSERFGGEGRMNPSPIYSEPAEKDHRPDSIRISLASMSTCMFLAIPDKKEENVKERRKRKEPAVWTSIQRRLGKVKEEKNSIE